MGTQGDLEILMIILHEKNTGVLRFVEDGYGEINVEILGVRGRIKGDFKLSKADAVKLLEFLANWLGPLRMKSN
jgi:hypothetical protein